MWFSGGKGNRLNRTFGRGGGDCAPLPVQFLQPCKGVGLVNVGIGSGLDLHVVFEGAVKLEDKMCPAWSVNGIILTLGQNRSK